MNTLALEIWFFWVGWPCWPVPGAQIVLIRDHAVSCELNVSINVSVSVDVRFSCNDDRRLMFGCLTNQSGQLAK